MNRGQYPDSYWAGQQMRLVFDEYPDHGSKGKTGKPPWKSMATHADTLRTHGFREVDEWAVEGDYRDVPVWKRADEFRVIYITVTRGSGARIEHRYLDSTVCSCFIMDDSYARDLLKGYGNDYMFLYHGPINR